MAPCGFLIPLNFLDQFPVDPAIAPISATGHQLVTLWRSICAEERAQFSDPLMGSKCSHFVFHSFCNFPLFIVFSCSQN